MPILELTQLRLKGVEPTHPSLLDSLSVVRGKLHTNSRFYNCIEDRALIFILGIWPSLDAHLEFLHSPARDEVLGPQEHLLDFQWTVHVEIDAMADLPLDAPVMAIARLFVNSDAVHAFRQAAAKHVQLIAERTQHNAVNGWRYDAEPGKHEALVITGWESAESHAAFTAKACSENPDYPAMEGLYEDMKLYHARNMERPDF
jgi:heme-degrading monooxygenase HmoA